MKISKIWAGIARLTQAHILPHFLRKPLMVDIGGGAYALSQPHSNQIAVPEQAAGRIISPLLKVIGAAMRGNYGYGYNDTFVQERIFGHFHAAFGAPANPNIVFKTGKDAVGPHVLQRHTEKPGVVFYNTAMMGNLILMAEYMRDDRDMMGEIERHAAKGAEGFTVRALDTFLRNVRQEHPAPAQRQYVTPAAM